MQFYDIFNDDTLADECAFRFLLLLHVNWYHNESLIIHEGHPLLGYNNVHSDQDFYTLIGGL
jgi:hypothetical protein